MTLPIAYSNRARALLRCGFCFVLLLTNCEDPEVAGPRAEEPADDDDPADDPTGEMDSGLRRDAALSGEAPTKADAAQADVSNATAEGGMGAGNAPMPSITVGDRSATTQAWWKYERAAKYTVVSTSVLVPMRDGEKIGCKLGRPGTNGSVADGKFPGLVVEFTPYLLNAGNNIAEGEFFVKRGYNALTCTLRGIGDSTDTWHGAGSSQDWRDAHDLVEWLATQPFSDGRIGQFGESYGGQTTYGSASEQPPHLLAIAPMQPPADLYDDVNYPGGLETTQGGTINSWPPIAELLSFGAISAQKEYQSWHDHPTFDSFWQDRSLIGRHEKIQVPVLTIGGWIDIFFRAGTLTNIEAALARTWAIYGQWEHLPPVDLGICSSSSCVKEPLPPGVLLAWFDHWVMQLKDVPIPAQPTFVSEQGPRSGSPNWRELSSWVVGGTQALSYKLGDGTLSADGADKAVTFHEPGEASVSGATATFSTSPLTEDHVLLGRPTLDVRASLSSGDANFYVELLDVDASDKETFVNNGFLRASYHESHVTPAPVPVGQPIDYQIAIRPMHWRFAKGHRVRIRIWGGQKDTVVQAQPVDVTLQSGTLRMPWFAAPP